MQILIDIGEPPFYKDIYTAICERGYIDDEDNEIIANAIKNGIPLDKIRAEIKELRYGQPFRKFVVDECLDVIDKYKTETEDT